jgi:hypothetical protein
MYLAQRQPEWPLLGISLSGIHDTAPPMVRSAWDSMPAGQPVVFTPDQRRLFFYGPDWTMEPDIVERAEVSASPIPLAELLEVVGSWPEAAASVAGGVRVPVQFFGFEFESLWTISPQTVESFGSYFRDAPRKCRNNGRDRARRGPSPFRTSFSTQTIGICIGMRRETDSASQLAFSGEGRCKRVGLGPLKAQTVKGGTGESTTFVNIVGIGGSGGGRRRIHRTVRYLGCGRCIKPGASRLRCASNVRTGFLS